MPTDPGSMRFAVLTDAHLAVPGTPDAPWNNLARYSMSRQLLADAVTAITEAGISDVLVLGDTAHRGDADHVHALLDTLEHAGLRSMILPGNHDVALDPAMVGEVVEKHELAEAIDSRPRPLHHEVDIAGQIIRSDDGGRTCESYGPSGHLGDSRLFVWAAHYPVLSQQDLLDRQGLRYPGDLTDCAAVAARLLTSRIPVLVLHGHLHAATVDWGGPIAQVGIPALVEWPHAWASANIRVEPDDIVATVHIHALHPDWPHTARTMLGPSDQIWLWQDGLWTMSAGIPREKSARAE